MLLFICLLGVETVFLSVELVFLQSGFLKFTISPVALSSQRSAGLCLPSAEVEGVRVRPSAWQENILDPVFLD